MTVWARSVLVLGVAVSCTALACRSEQACLELRGRGFEVINGVHPCADDSDCRVSEWPACGKPLNAASEEKLGDLRRRSVESGCDDESTSCGQARAVYCDRNFCVARPVPLVP